MTDPDDICVCGDYRRQHRGGTGPCELRELCTPSRCSQFRIFKTAVSVSASARIDGDRHIQLKGEIE